jgi:NADPH:quinone reductase-like Zn-dependent oxidoreductase
MKAIFCTGYGSPDVLQLKEIPKPLPRKNEVLVRVYASSVSSGVVWIRQGRFPGSWFFTIMIRFLFGIYKPRNPILGFEFSGVVEAVGESVTHYKKGDEVYGTTTGLRTGAYADYLCLPQKWKLGVIAKKPASLSFEEAAALPVGAMTALALLKKARIKKGQHILIYGALGSVGSYAVQIAKYFGATVTAVCSTPGLCLARSIGADAVIDYTQDDLSAYAEQFDLVFDAVNKLDKKLARSLRKQGGHYFSVRELTIEKSAYLEELHEMIFQCKVRPLIDKIYSLPDIREAHAYVDHGRKKGNVVLRHWSVLKWQSC